MFDLRSKKAKRLIISMSLLLSLSASAITSTLAWFTVREMSIRETDFISGEMGIDIVGVTSYKYVYPKYDGTDMINYDSPSSGVLTSDVTGLSNADENDYLRLNKLDTASIYLSNGGSETISESTFKSNIKEQNTSLLLKIDFTSVNTEDVSFTLKSDRLNADEFDYSSRTSNLSNASLLASDFVSFTGFLDPDLREVTSSGGNLDTAIWEHFRTLHEGSSYSDRRYFHMDSSSNGTSLNVLSSILGKNPTKEAANHTIYLFVEYEPTHVNPYFMMVDRLRYSYRLLSDFYFTLSLNSEVSQ